MTDHLQLFKSCSYAGLSLANAWEARRFCRGEKKEMSTQNSELATQLSISVLHFISWFVVPPVLGHLIIIGLASKILGPPTPPNSESNQIVIV